MQYKTYGRRLIQRNGFDKVYNQHQSSHQHYDRMHEVLFLLSSYCSIELLASLAACSRQCRDEVHGELVQQQFLRLIPSALHHQSLWMLDKQQLLSRTHRMQWLCKAAGSEFIKAQAAAIAAVCLQARMVDELAAQALYAAGLKMPYSSVLAAAPRTAPGQYYPCYRSFV
jgi:hypothetical protein